MAKDMRISAACLLDIDNPSPRSLRRRAAQAKMNAILGRKWSDASQALTRKDTDSVSGRTQCLLPAKGSAQAPSTVSPLKAGRTCHQAGWVKALAGSDHAFSSSLVGSFCCPWILVPTLEALSACCA